jgi:hypothetical protein
MQILLHLPDDIANRFKTAIPPRKRSAFIAELLEKALPQVEQNLYEIALEVEQDESLNKSLECWENTIRDGVWDD